MMYLSLNKVKYQIKNEMCSWDMAQRLVGVYTCTYTSTCAHSDTYTDKQIIENVI